MDFGATTKRAVLVIALLVGVGVSIAGAQPPVRPGRGRGVPPATDEAATSPAEIQRLFDAYVVMQAQQDLQLTDAQFAGFLSKIRALQDVRRRDQVERLRLLQDLRRLLQAPGQNDDGLRTALRAVADHDARAAVDERQAMDGVDEVLDLRQQARFRVLEEMMERRKLELLLRARQATRLRNQQQP